MNVEDLRNGVAEYVIEKYADKVIIELKWGQGAKSIGGEIQVKDIEYATFLKRGVTLSILIQKSLKLLKDLKTVL